MSSPESCEDVQERVLESLQDGFMKCVVAKAIAHKAADKKIIPQTVETDILNAKDDSNANHYMFVHLRSQATVKDLRELCSIMKDAKGNSKMIGFGETLEAELDKIFPHQEEAATDGRLMQQPRCGHCGAESGIVASPAEITSSSSAKEVQRKVVARGEFQRVRSLAGNFVVTVGRIVGCLITESLLAPLKAAALSRIALQDLPNPPSRADINNASDVQKLFNLLHIDSNWVDISLLEQVVTVSGSKSAAAILAEYMKSHEAVIADALARLVDPSTDGTCPRPDTYSCILQLVFSDKREGMRVQEVLACKDFLYDWFGVQPERIMYISAVIGNSLVVTWLVSRRIGLRIVNQCRSPPVLAVLQEMEVIAVRLRYPGQLIAVEVDVNLHVFESCPQVEEVVRSGDLHRVQEFIRGGVDVNEGDMDELSFVCKSLLIVAIEEGHEDVALELLSAGADIHVKDRDGRTALHWACEKRLEEVVEVLISLGSHVDEQDMFGNTPVMLAADWSNTAISMHLVRAGASCEGLSEYYMSLLFRRACHESQSDLTAVQTLLEGGCCVGILSGDEQERLLHHACREGDVLVVCTLLKNGCMISILSSEEQEWLLYDACCEGNVFVVSTLLKNGCTVSILSREEQEQLLRHGCREDDVFVVRTLLKNGCTVNILSREEQEQLLHHACREDDVFVVRILLKNGCTVSILPREEQERLLYHACCEDDVFVVHTLLKNGCRVSILSREERERLLHHACREDNLFVVRTLLKNGCMVSILSREERERLLHHACREDDVLVVRTLLKNGCRVSILSREEQETLFHFACHEHDAFVVHTLIQNGCSLKKLTQVDLLYCVHILSKQKIVELLHLACHDGDVFVVHTLLENGGRVSILSREEQEKLFLLACHDGDVFVVHTLLENGGRVSILSREEQEKLFLLACHDGDVFVVHTLLENGGRVSILSREEQEKLFLLACHDGDVFVVHTLLENGGRVSILSREEQEKLFLLACREGDVFVVHTLLENGCQVEGKRLLCLACNEGDAFVVEILLISSCDMDCVDSAGFTPLMHATVKDHEEVVKRLILAGANLGIQCANGDTALHLAAKHNRIQCGILLAEGGASVRTRNNLSQTPLDLASAEFKEAIKEALSFTTRKALCVIGNAESGKSTLIAALQAERNSLFGKIANRFRRVSDRRQRTAGIETVFHSSRRYGEVLFFDFAGQDDYHGPHQMFLESLLSKPGVSMTLLLVVKMTEEEDAILHQLHRWLSPVALMATPASPPQVIIIGSFLDKVRSKEEATAKLTRCIQATKRDLDGLPLEVLGSSFLNCRQPQSRGIDQICAFLQEIPVPEFSATHTRYSLAWVLSQIRSSFTAEAVQLKEFSAWVQDNKNNLPRTMPPPEEVCQDLSAASHALYLPNREDPSKSWLVLDLPSILHDVYGTLFSKYREIVNEFGLVHCHHLAKLFPHKDLEMVQHLLIGLEFCLPVDPSILKVELRKLVQSKEDIGWLFFPALISPKPPQSTLKGHPLQSVQYFCWQLRTAKKHSISARLLQTILLRLAAHFVVKQHNEKGVQQHCCNIWGNGIEWQSTKGIGVTVHIIRNRVIHVVGAGHTSTDKLCQYLTDVISDILSTVHRLSPKLAAGAYIVHSPKSTMSPEDIIALPTKKLFPVEGIRNSIRDGYCLSLEDSNTNRSTRAVISDLFGGCTPSLEDIGRINWPRAQPDPSQPQSPSGTSLPDALSQTVYTCEGYLILFRTYVSRPSAGKGRAVLEKIGLEPETIRACYGRHPLEEEEAVQDGLIKWVEGHHGYSPTWRMLLDAMEYAGVAQHHCQGLRDELYQKLIEVPATPSQPQSSAEQSEADMHGGAVSGSPTPSDEQALHISSQSPSVPNQPELYSEGRQTEGGKEGSQLTDSTTTPSGAQALLGVSSSPDMRDVDELVVMQVAANWQRVALRLGVEGCVSEVLWKNHPYDCEGACRDMLGRWLRRDPHTGEEERTWSTLLIALGRAGFEELERRLRREHFYKTV